MSSRALSICWMVLLVLGLSLVYNEAISVSGNGYEFTIAISENAMNITADDRLPFLESLKTTMTLTSKMLFEATDYNLYLKKINILVPRTWISILNGVTPTTAHDYLNADMRIETTMESSTKMVEEPRTYNSKSCGQSGEYIIATPYFFLNEDTMNRFGDKAKVMLHLFANYRYGVHEEHGFFAQSDKFTYTFMNPRGDWQVTGCNNTKIEGEYKDSMGMTCTYPESSDCRFRPNMTATTGPTTSLMFLHFLPTVSKFCDSSNHDRAAANKQNYWCRNRSVKTVMRQSPEFTNITPMPNTTNTAPEFIYQVRASQTVYLVFDTSSHTLADDAVFNYTKTQISQSLIQQLASASPRSFVGIATMGGTIVNSTGRLGGYLTEVQTPIQINTNQQTLINKINSLTRSSGSGLLLEKAVLDVGDIMTSFTHLSGSIALLVKLNDITDPETMNVESEAVHLLNSRNSRLVSFEYNVDSTKNVLERTSKSTNGFHFTANAGNLQTVFPTALSKMVELVRETLFLSKRVQLVRDAFTTNSVTPFRGSYTIDYKSSMVEVHFFIPSQRTGNYDIIVNAFNGTSYTLASPEHTQQYSSWDRKYKIHTFSFMAEITTGTATFTVSTVGDAMSGYVEVVEVLDQNAPNYIGGGGMPADRVVEVEVRTSGDNGVLNMNAAHEDTSFLIYVSVRRGYYVARSLNSSKAIVHGPGGTQEEVSLRDNGLYPDVLARDGIYSGFYRPPGSSSPANYRISVRLEGYRNPRRYNYEDSGRLLPIDQENVCCGSMYTLPGTASSFLRYYPYAASLQIRSSNFYKERPLRIMDFKIDDSNLNNVTFSWTAPQESFGKNVSVNSYRLVYSTNPSAIINERGEIPESATSFTDNDILEGSLIPAQPYESQTVTINLNRNGPAPAPFYFTIASTRVASNNAKVESYPAPMVYLTGTGTAEVSTTTSTTTTTTTTSTTTTPIRTTPTTPTSPTTTTKAPTPTTTAATITTRPTASTTTGTTIPNGAERTLIVAPTVFLLSIISIAFIF